MSRSTKSINNLKYAIVGQGLGIFISFISRIFFVRYLGSEYLGINGLFTNLLTVLSLAELGIGEAINFSLYKPLAEKDINKCKMLMDFYKKVYTVIGIVIFILGLIITPFLSLIINEFPKNENMYIIFMLFVFNTSVSYFFSYKRNLIIADQNRYIATIYRYSFYFVLNVVQIIMLFFTRNYILFLLLQILSTFMENIFISNKANDMYSFLKNNENIKLDDETKKEIVKNTKAMMMHKIGGLVVSSTDNILISTFVNLTSVGIYSNYCLIINALNSIFSQFYNSIIASIGNMCVGDSKQKQYDIYKKIDFAGFVMYSFSFVCIFIMINTFIKIWLGKDYIFSQAIVLIIAINFYIGGMRKSNMSFREASGLFYKDRWKPIAESIVNLIASILLMSKYGLIGVFLGTFISSITICVWVEPFVLFKYGFNLKLKIYFKEYFKYLIFTMFVLVQVVMITNFINFNIYLNLIVRFLLCVSIYMINFYIFFRNNENYLFYQNLIRNKLTLNSK